MVENKTKEETKGKNLPPRKIEYLIIHFSASTFGNVREINNWHKQRNFPISPISNLYCGYHYVILPSGKVEQGRLDREAGCHCRGYNEKSIGICFIGNDKPNTQQWNSLLFLCRIKKKEYSIKTENILGHCETKKYVQRTKKKCPGFDVAELREAV